MIRLYSSDKAEVDIISEHALNRFIERSDLKTTCKNKLTDLNLQLDRFNEEFGNSILNLDLEITREAIIEKLNYYNSSIVDIAKSRIAKLLKQTKQITPRNSCLKLLNHRFKEAKYYLNDGYVFVISTDKTLITIMKFEPVKWRYTNP